MSLSPRQFLSSKSHLIKKAYGPVFNPGYNPAGVGGTSDIYGKKPNNTVKQVQDPNTHTIEYRTVTNQADVDNKGAKPVYKTNTYQYTKDNARDWSNEMIKTKDPIAMHKAGYDWMYDTRSDAWEKNYRGLFDSQGWRDKLKGIPDAAYREVPTGKTGKDGKPVTNRAYYHTYNYSTIDPRTGEQVQATSAMPLYTSANGTLLPADMQYYRTLQTQAVNEGYFMTPEDFKKKQSDLNANFENHKLTLNGAGIPKYVADGGTPETTPIMAAANYMVARGIAPDYKTAIGQLQSQGDVKKGIGDTVNARIRAVLPWRDAIISVPKDKRDDKWLQEARALDTYVERLNNLSYNDAARSYLENTISYDDQRPVYDTFFGKGTTPGEDYAAANNTWGRRIDKVFDVLDPFNLGPRFYYDRHLPKVPSNEMHQVAGAGLTPGHAVYAPAADLKKMYQGVMDTPIGRASRYAGSYTPASWLGAAIYTAMPGGRREGESIPGAFLRNNVEIGPLDMAYDFLVDPTINMGTSNWTADEASKLYRTRRITPSDALHPAFVNDPYVANGAIPDWMTRNEALVNVPLLATTFAGTGATASGVAKGLSAAGKGVTNTAKNVQMMRVLQNQAARRASNIAEQNAARAAYNPAKWYSSVAEMYNKGKASTYSMLANNQAAATAGRGAYMMHKATTAPFSFTGFSSGINSLSNQKNPLAAMAMRPVDFALSPFGKFTLQNSGALPTPGHNPNDPYAINGTVGARVSWPWETNNIEAMYQTSQNAIVEKALQNELAKGNGLKPTIQTATEPATQPATQPTPNPEPEVVDTNGDGQPDTVLKPEQPKPEQPNKAPNPEQPTVEEKFDLWKNIQDHPWLWGGGALGILGMLGLFGGDMFGSRRKKRRSSALDYFYGDY